MALSKLLRYRVGTAVAPKPPPVPLAGPYPFGLGRDCESRHTLINPGMFAVQTGRRQGGRRSRQPVQRNGQTALGRHVRARAGRETAFAFGNANGRNRGASDGRPRRRLLPRRQPACLPCCPLYCTPPEAAMSMPTCSGVLGRRMGRAAPGNPRVCRGHAPPSANRLRTMTPASTCSGVPNAQQKPSPRCGEGVWPARIGEKRVSTGRRGGSAGWSPGAFIEPRAA